MALEVEAKVKVDSHDAVRQRLRALGARWVSRVLESNHIFDTADRTLLAGGRGLRVRAYVEGEGEVPSAAMTYKGPVHDSKLKVREEIQTAVDDADAAIALLQSLGFVEAVSFEKRRETWQLGDCTIELDELPHLGCYVEIEGPGEPAIEDLLARLELAALTRIRESYIALLVNHCRGHDLPATQISFR